MGVTVRVLNYAGLCAFRAHLEHLVQGGSDPTPSHLLEEPSNSEPLPVMTSVDPSIQFRDKLEFGEHLASALMPLLRTPRMESHVGLWTWLSLCYFDQVCPAAADGTRRPGASYRHVLSQDFKHHYRHLVRTPCLVYWLHGKHGRVVLSGPLHRHGEASEQVLSREHLFTNKALFAAMDLLYMGQGANDAQRLKPGASGRIGGSMRRLGKVARQFDLTYDLQAMPPERILGLLPAEFDRFKK